MQIEKIVLANLPGSFNLVEFARMGVKKIQISL